MIDENILLKNDLAKLNESAYYFEVLKCTKYKSAVHFLDITREINIITTIIIIIIGLIGNTLAVIVFMQKRFRQKSSEVFLLVLTISDCLFLLTHFFEDTLRTYIDFYIRKNRGIIPIQCYSNKIELNIVTTISEDNIFLILNITDKFVLTCKIVNYFRYLLRFISAYIITIFTIQRAIAVYFPFYQKTFTPSALAWKIVTCLVLVLAIVCSFVPILFKLNEDTNTTNHMPVIYCDMDKSKSQLYFITTITYIVLIMVIPIATIIICNTLIILKVYNASEQRKFLFAENFHSKVKGDSNNIYEESNFLGDGLPLSKSLTANLKNSSTESCHSDLYNIDTVSSQKSISKLNLAIKGPKKCSKLRRYQKNSLKVTRMMIIMSFSYAILNLPYFITWCMFYYSEAIKQQGNFINSKYLFGFINLAEIFYILNYGIHFFLYCASGKKFRHQLKSSFAKTRRKKYSSNLLKIEFILKLILFFFLDFVY